jgi:hypothetical protein
MNSYIEFKFGKDKKLFELLNPILKQTIFDLSLWCEENDLPFKITETITTKKIDKRLNRVSDSHRTLRAVDLSIKKWSEKQLAIFQTLFNERYKNIASVSRTDNIPRLIVIHGEGDNRHIHLAINARYAQPEIPEEEYQKFIREN